MPNYFSRKDLARLVNQSVQYIGVNVKRGKLVERNKRIDIDNPKNKAFLLNFMSKDVFENSKGENEIIEKEIEAEFEESDPTEITSINQGNIKYALDIAELKRKRIVIQKERLDLDKKKGHLIEIQPAKEIMQRAIIVLSSQYQQQWKLYLVEMCAKFGIDNSEIAGIQKDFDKTINKAVEDSRELINDECTVVTKEYSRSLNIGESKK